MSVIFRTLKKLKAEQSDAGKSRERRVPGKKIHAFDASLYSSTSVLLMLVVFIVLGAGSLFGYFQLRDKDSKKVEAFSISNTDIRQSTDVPLYGKIENIGEKGLNSAKHPGLNPVEYRPPEASDNGVEVYGSVRSTKAKAPSAAIRKTSETSHMVSKIQTRQPEKSSTSKVSPVPDVGKVFLANAKKNATISRLVADIKWEMDHGDKDRIEELFDELSLIKGQNDSYVLKLKAVWHIRNQEYEGAADLLKTVLSKNEFDLEAGINMAIIEISTRQEQNAYRRLEKLQQIYPENIRLAEILQNLRRLFNREQTRHLSRHDG
jgi:hypothetical protein